MDIFGSISSFFSTILWPLEWVVSGLLVVFHSLWGPLLPDAPGWAWALSIVCLTAVIRLLLVPLFVKQIKSMRNLQLLQPRVAEIRKKYGADKQRMSLEMNKLMREEGVNPAASCLPLLLQMPIFFALFNVLNGAARQVATGYWMVQNPDLVQSLATSTIFGARISSTFLPLNLADPTFPNVQIVTVVLILLMVGTMFYTQLQLTRKNMPPEALEGPMAQQQKMMLYLFPIVFAVGGVNFPVGVLIYWFVSNLWTMGQQGWIIRNNPTPGTPAYAAWEARIIAKGGDPREKDPTYAKRKRMEEGRANPAANGSKSGQRNDDGTDGETNDPPKVQRQQPRKQSRSKRRGSEK